LLRASVAVELREPVLDNFDRAPASAAPFSTVVAPAVDHRSGLVCRPGNLRCRDHYKICTLQWAHLPGICSAESLVGWFHSERLAVQHLGQPKVLGVWRGRGCARECQTNG